MATRQSDGTFIIAAGEVGAFTVCARAWKLKWIDREAERERAPEVVLGQELHRDWSALFEEAFLLTRWVRYLAVLLCTAVVVFLFAPHESFDFLTLFSPSVRSAGMQLLVVVAMTLVVIRFLGRAAKTKHEDTGVAQAEATVSVDGSSTLPAREYISYRQGLAGKPDALIREGDAIIPVERKPLARKLRDRYVAQILVYMRLIEEFEGIRPPYGYLVLGPSCRQIRVDNIEAKQAWLDRYLLEMRRILNGKEAISSPHPVKCSKCDVKHRCPDRVDRKEPGGEITTISKKER